MNEPTAAPVAKTYDIAITDMVKMLINDLVDEANTNGYGDTTREKIRSHLKHGAGENTMHGITALSAFASAKAAERQATAMESIAKTASRLQVAESLDTNAQAIVDQRTPKREDLATTYSLPTEILSLLWSVRGMLMDAAIKSLSVPSRFDSYQQLSTEEIAWSLRLSPDEFWRMLPRTTQGAIDFALLEAFDLLHYGGTDAAPDSWLYGG